VSDKKNWDWLYKGVSLSLLTKDPKDSRRAYREFMAEEGTEVPDSKVVAPDKEMIQHLVCKTYGIIKEEMIKSKRGVLHEPRGAAISLTRMIINDGRGDMCRDYDLKKERSASSVVDGVKQRLSKDGQFFHRVTILSANVIKGQSGTCALF
jgi:hypothetical protein